MDLGEWAFHAFYIGKFGLYLFAVHLLLRGRLHDGAIAIVLSFLLSAPAFVEQMARGHFFEMTLFALFGLLGFCLYVFFTIRCRHVSSSF